MVQVSDFDSRAPFGMTWPTGSNSTWTQKDLCEAGSSVRNLRGITILMMRASDLDSGQERWYDLSPEAIIRARTWKVSTGRELQSDA